MTLKDATAEASIFILSLEDSALDYELICVRLRKDGIRFESQRAVDKSSFLSALASCRVDIILSDYNLPGFNGLDALAAAQEAVPHVPFVFVSGALGEDIATESLKRGAVDYVTKQKLGRLGAAVKRAIAEYREKAARERAEQQLKLTQDRLQLALDATSDGLWDLELPNSLYWSDRFKQMLGYTHEWTPSIESWHEMVHPDDREVAQGMMNDYLARKLSAYRNVYRIRHRDGSYRWIESRGTAMWDQKGNPVRMVGGTTDITDRKLANLALQASEERWRTLTEAMPQLVWIDRGTDGYCEYLSAQWAEYTGVSVDKLMGFEWLKLLHPDDEARTAAAWQDAVADKADYNIEYRIRRHDGEYRWFKVRGVPARDASGAIALWYGTCTDIHDLKIAEHNAEAANKAKSEFLANMSHEIRTPMNAVIGLSTILTMNSDLNAKQREIVTTLQLSAQSLLGLINDLLDISKIETNMVDIEKIPFSLPELISDIVSVNAHRAEEKRIKLSCVLSKATQQSFLGDPTRIRQIITNLVSNGLKFTDQGGVTISVDSTPGESENVQILHIQVADTGIGIAPEKLVSIFDKFTQADSSTTRKYGGTGLGLAISKNLAEIMGGSITVRSQFSIGTEFTFHVPLEEAEPDSAPAEAAADIHGERSSSGSLGNILLVEDYAPNVMVAKSILENLGYSCDTASNGKEAIAMLRAARDKFGAVLMDVQMPDMDGLEATRLIRKEEKSKGLKPVAIVAMTAHALNDDKDRCLSAGMNAYIAKPFQPQNLGEVLKDLYVSNGV